MARIINSYLAAKQSSDLQPYIHFVLQSRGLVTSCDYSFDPRSKTNRMESIEHHEEPYDDYATIVLNNEDLSVPDVRGYSVDIGYGANTTDGLKPEAIFPLEHNPRLWVQYQDSISSAGNLKTVLYLAGIWRIMKDMPLRIGTPPYFEDESDVLEDLTVYDILEYVIETALGNVTGLVFTLSPLGDQDDGIIDTLVPGGEAVYPAPSAARPAKGSTEQGDGKGETFANYLTTMMSFTNCYLRTEPNLNFRVIFPQSGDSVNETYYSSLTGL
jgi:hypothetical protein